MKKIGLVFGVVYAVITFAQNQSDKFIPSIYNTINKESLENGYTLIEQIHLWGNGSIWSNYEKINFIYNEHNQLIEKKYLAGMILPG